MLHIISGFCTVGNIVIFYWQKCSLFPFFFFWLLQTIFSENLCTVSLILYLQKQNTNSGTDLALWKICGPGLLPYSCFVPEKDQDCPGTNL